MEQIRGFPAPTTADGFTANIGTLRKCAGDCGVPPIHKSTDHRCGARLQTNNDTYTKGSIPMQFVETIDGEEIWEDDGLWSCSCQPGTGRYAPACQHILEAQDSRTWNEVLVAREDRWHD